MSILVYIYSFLKKILLILIGFNPLCSWYRMDLSDPCSPSPRLNQFCLLVLSHQFVHVDQGIRKIP